MPKISVTLPPITITKASQEITPISLVRVDDSENRLALGVLYSDNSIKVCTWDENAIAIDENTVDLAYDYNGCETPEWHTTPFGDDYEPIEVTTGWTECSIVDGHPQGALYIEIDGVRFVSNDTELVQNEGTGFVEYTDFHTLNVG